MILSAVKTMGFYLVVWPPRFLEKPPLNGVG